jgi:hypothetical protein
MHRNSRQSVGWAIVLILFGIGAFVGGVKWLIPLIPAAMLIWFAVGPSLRTGRN